MAIHEDYGDNTSVSIYNFLHTSILTIQGDMSYYCDFNEYNKHQDYKIILNTYKWLS